MQYRKLRGTELTISTHILGTDYFGTDLSPQDAARLMDAYRDAGGNTLDTARIYGGWIGGKLGTSEEVLGEYLKSRGCRGEVIIATKCAHHDLRDSSIRRLSRADIVADVEDSLRALQTDYIDFLWLHRDDTNRPVEEIIDTLDSLVTSGKVRYVGASNWRARRIAEANAYAAQAGKAPLCASQVQWSLAAETSGGDPTLVAMDAAEYPYYQTHSFPVFAYASQAKGFFKKYAEGGEASLSEKAKNRYYTQENLEYYNRAKKIAEENGISISAVVLGYLLSQPMEVYPILGCKTLPQLEDSLQNSDFRLTAEQVNALTGGRGF